MAKFKDYGEEFDELVKLQQSFTKNIENLFDVFGIQAGSKLREYQKMNNLPLNQYFAVISATVAIEAYGKGEIGSEIYKRNKRSYISHKILSKTLNRLNLDFSKFLGSF